MKIDNSDLHLSKFATKTEARSFLRCIENTLTDDKIDVNCKYSFYKGFIDGDLLHQ